MIARSSIQQLFGRSGYVTYARAIGRCPTTFNRSVSNPSTVTSKLVIVVCELLSLAKEAGHCPIRLLDRSRQSAPVGRGRISLLTRAEQSTWCWAEPIKVRHIYIGHDCLEDTAQTVFGRSPQSVEIQDQVSAEDPVLLNCFHMLENELRNGGMGQRLMIDALRNQIAVHMLRRYARIRLADESGSAFSPTQRKRIIDLIEDQLSENISLDDLAAAVGLSPFHFSRQFKADFGIAPYAFVIQKRVSKAQEMLRRGRLPLKSVALDCGFSDQSHLCRTFRKIVGVTPAQYQNRA